MSKDPAKDVLGNGLWNYALEVMCVCFDELINARENIPLYALDKYVATLNITYKFVYA